MSLSSLIDNFIQDLWAIQATRYCALAGVTVVVFDHLLTLDDEVQFIWKRSWTLGKVLFLAIRYYSLAVLIFSNYAFLTSHLTPSFCRHVIRLQGWSGWIICVLAEGILQMRIYALYGMSKRILAFMLTCFATTSSLSIWVLTEVLVRDAAQVLPIPGGNFCVPGSESLSWFWSFWIPILVFEILLCILAVISGIQTRRRQNANKVRLGRIGLVEVLVRDSVAYFLVIGATYLTCFLIWIVAPVRFTEMPIFIAIAMSCIMGNRVLLNVRRAALDSSTTNLPGSVIIWGARSDESE